MSTVNAPGTVVRHRKDWQWEAPRWLVNLGAALLAGAVYVVWGFVAGPFLVDLIGLWPTRAVAVALIAAAWRWC